MPLPSSPLADLARVNLHFQKLQLLNVEWNQLLAELPDLHCEGQAEREHRGKDRLQTKKEHCVKGVGLYGFIVLV